MGDIEHAAEFGRHYRAAAHKLKKTDRIRRFVSCSARSDDQLETGGDDKIFLFDLLRRDRKTGVTG
jgi:hypothetical protein